MSAKTEHRRPHTVYLRDEIWEALDRRYLETRLNSPAPSSKIEFIEQVLEAGMETLAPARADLSSAEENWTSPTQTAQEIAEKTTRGDSGANAPTLSGNAQRNEQEPAETTSPARPSPQQRVARRSSALERLMRASEPGRPAPINSAATSEDQETQEHQ